MTLLLLPGDEPARRFAKWNVADKAVNIVLSGNDLTAYSAGGWNAVRADIGKGDGIHYYEGLVTAVPYLAFGFATAGNPLSYHGDSGGLGWGIASHGYDMSPGSISANGYTLIAGDYVGCLMNWETELAKFWRIRAGTPALVYTADISAAAGYLLYPMFAGLDGIGTINSGASAFQQAVPEDARQGVYI